MSIKIWIEIDPFRAQTGALVLLLRSFSSLGLKGKEGEIIDLFHTALNSTRELFAPTLYCYWEISFRRALEASSRGKSFFPFDGTNIKTSSTLLNGIEANLHVNKTWKQQCKESREKGRNPLSGHILWCLWAVERETSEHNNRIMYVTLLLHIRKPSLPSRQDQREHFLWHNYQRLISLIRETRRMEKLKCK